MKTAQFDNILSLSPAGDWRTINIINPKVIAQHWGLETTYQEAMEDAYTLETDNEGNLHTHYIESATISIGGAIILQFANQYHTQH